MVRSTVDAEITNAPGRWTLILAILGAAMATAEVISGSMLPLMARGLETTEGMVGQAVTASAIVAILTSLSIGSIAANHDRRKLLIVFTLFLVASNLGVALAPNVWVMLGARMLLGAAIGIVWGLIPAIVLRLSPPGQFAKSFSTVMIGVSAASLVAAPLAAYVGARTSWRLVYLAAAVLAIVAVALLAMAFPALPARPGALNRDLKGTLRLPGMLTGMLGILLIFAGAQAFFGYMVPFVEQVTGLGSAAVSLTLLCTGLSGLIGTLIASRTLSFSTYGVMVAAPAVMAILLTVVLRVGHIVIPAIAVLMMWSLARAHMGLGANAWIAHNFAEHAEGAGGILVAVIQGAMMLGAMLGGVLIDTNGAKAPPLAAAIILGMGAVYCLYALKPSPLAEVSAPIAPLSPVPEVTVAVPEDVA